MDSKRVYFPNMDGLRFFAFFSVFLFHSFYTPNTNIKNNIVYSLSYNITRHGHLGVNFFFVLSGFLITYLLLSEIEFKGSIDIGAFYMRRILRIWPLYFMVVFLGFCVYPWFKYHFGHTALLETAKPWYFFFFLSNFNNLYNGCNTPTLTLLWSVSVEEQFYLIWPLLISVIPASRLGWLFSGVIILSIGFRFFHMNEPNVLGLHTLALIGDMALGGLMAWLCFRDKRLTDFIANLPKWVIVLVYGLGIILICQKNYFEAIYLYVVFERVILGAFFAFILIEQNYAKNSFYKMQKFPLFSYLGTYTYGLYCLHYLALLLAIWLLNKLTINHSVVGVIIGDNVVGLVIAFAFSWISFNFYEKPFLKFKNRFAFITRD